jgi:hypothetical protein
MNETHEVYAYFAQTLTLSIITTEGGTTSPEPGTYPCLYGDTLSINAIPNSGYTFEKWVYNEYWAGGNWKDTYTDNPLSLTIYEDCILQPIFVSSEGTIEDYRVESPHPYPNNYDNSWIITKEGATAIRVHFEYIDVEEYWDHVYVMDGSDNVVEDYSGFFSNPWSPWVAGSTVKVRLTSDSSVTYNGFKIDKICWTDQPLPEWDFSISVSPEKGTVPQGSEEPTSAKVLVTLVRPPEKTVSLSLSELPEGVSASFNPLQGEPPFVSTLEIYTADSTPIGTYNITIVATAGDLVKNVTYLLDVREASRVTFKARFQYHGEYRDASGYDWVLSVDDQYYLASHLPKTFHWSVGSSHTFTWFNISLDESSYVSGNDLRYNWAHSEGLSTERSGNIIAPPNGGEVTAYYSRYIYVRRTKIPVGVGVYSPDEGWHPEGTAFTAISTTEKCVPGYWRINDEGENWSNPITIWDPCNLWHYFRIRLTIRVVDTDGNGLEGVNVTITDTCNGTTWTLPSNSSGYAIFYLKITPWSGPPWYYSGFAGNVSASITVSGVPYNFVRWESGGGLNKYTTTTIGWTIYSMDDNNQVFWYVIYQKS